MHVLYQKLTLLFTSFSNISRMMQIFNQLDEKIEKNIYGPLSSTMTVNQCAGTEVRFSTFPQNELEFGIPFHEKSEK